MSNETMQAVQVKEYGGPEQLTVVRVPRPELKPGQVLVRLKAAGVNPADWKMRAGYFKQFMPLPFPWIPGQEGAGIVESVAPDVTSFKKGDEVYGPIVGSYAEYAAAAATDLLAKPKHLSFQEAASVPVGALTAWQAVIEEAEIQPGQRVLVHGGAGGVGIYAVQFARWRGARVTATASAANADFVKSLGADQVIDYHASKFENVVKDVDAVVDTVGGDLVERSLPIIRQGGVFVTVAGRVDPEMGQPHGVRTTSSRRADTPKLQQISELLESKKIMPVVGKVFPLAQARQAQELSQSGHGRGRIVLQIA